MKLHNIEQKEQFLRLCDQCQGQVYMKSIHGDCFNLKSCLSRLIVTYQLMSKHGSELQLFCMNHNDEPRFYEFFNEHPEVLHNEVLEN